ncbi:helix-turn-helix domain-containing protein [Streptomyces marincola]|uniref:helix-turn-helix domain-containing protein n=1 Tax=Streptomyces marincola TaxID=2878388 RepID=UPI001CF26D8B|nr:helix-turn-helix domain-containing protein [Streptomyces marincola]UCM91442.1 helix-turn-helix domain-containing protein [Streptomyces marincola]
MSIEEALSRLSEVPESPELTGQEPLPRVLAVAKILQAMAEVDERLRDVRREAILELRRQGMTIRQVAEAVGLSPGRVDQISRNSRV